MRSVYFFLFILVTISSAKVLAQTGPAVRGNVTTADGNPAEGITVTLGTTGLGALTNSQGDFVINRVKAGTYPIRVSSVGLKTAEQTITVTAGETTTVSFVLAENTAQLQEVIISAGQINRFSRTTSDYVSKMPLKNLENPQVYTSVGKELLAEQLVFSVDDAIRNAPGVQRMWEATGRSGDGGGFYNSRSFILQSSLRNGVAGYVSSGIDAVNLEKLEVIKGPSATLFGSALTSYGGLMNRVTKKPYETVGGEVTLAGGSYDFNRVSLDVNTPLNASRSLLLRVNTAYNYEGTFQTQGYTRSFALAPSLMFRPNERLSILLDAEITRVQSVGKQMIFFYFPADQLGATRADQLNLDYRNSYMGDGLSLNSRSTNLFGQINYRLSPTFTTSTNITSSQSFSDGKGAYFYLVPDNVVTGNPADAGKSNFLTRADQSTDNSRNTVFEVQQNLNGDFRIGSLRNRVVVGLDFLRINSNQRFFGSTFDTVPLNVPGFDYSRFSGSRMDSIYASGPPQFTYPIINKRNIYSAYASDVLNLTDQLSVLAALRVDHYDNKGGSEGGAVAAYQQTALSPKFGLVYQPVKDVVALFANYQNSFNNRGVYNAFDLQAPDSTSQRQAKLERANQVEAGVKLDAFGGKLSTTISYYSIRVNDILRTDPNPLAAARFAQIQDGVQTSKGVEMEVIANPARGLNVVAGFSYNDAKLVRADADVNGRRPSTASSPYLANLWVSYRLPDNLLKGLGVGVGGNYASDNKILNSVSQGVFILPAYTVLNASVFYTYRKFRVSGKVDNFTNQRYWVGYTTANPQKLRNFAGSVSYAF
ncbi:TonB-dependent receptor [Spirosoma sp. 209]|uniref:TonB-dependent receptor n=1 Tax=Spirosoma sp. 209 TaxID=1955701 RepID=UPI00098D3EA0|nr:TonB-dependent receptor [Spirosoma sp. 209]